MRLGSRKGGYDGHMSESTPENTETPDVGLVSDEELPEDLQPEENPLARDPDDESEDESGDESGSSDAKVEGMPDMGEPGASA